MERRTYLLLLTIILFSSGIFYVNNAFLYGYLRSKQNFANEIRSNVESIEDYTITKVAPFKFRLLFPAFIKSTYHAAFQHPDSQGFFTIYRFWSLIFFVTAACSMFFLLRACAFNDTYSFFGTLVFLLLPAMSLAYTLPVHTREDTLAYTIFFMALIFFLKDQKVLFLLFAVMGALCRETLLLLPLLYFFFSKDNNILRRLFISGLPCAVWLSVRLLMSQQEYDVWEGLKWNLQNPAQVVTFLFMTFAFCWLALFIKTLSYKRSIAHATEPVKFFLRSSWFTLIIILLTTIVGGIFNEIRLLYLFSPWMIVLTMDFIRDNRESMKAVLARKDYWLYSALCTMACAAVLYFALKYQDQLLPPGKHGVPYHLWIIVAMSTVLTFMLFLPLSITNLSLKKHIK